MSTDKTLKYIGTISYKDLHNQEIISKYDDKTEKKMLYSSTNKDRDMSNITKENPICFGYGIHWWVICIVKIIRFIVNTIFLLCSKCMLHIII